MVNLQDGSGIVMWHLHKGLSFESVDVAEGENVLPQLHVISVAWYATIIYDVAD